MAAVWIVATGENYEGMDTRNMLMFDNEESATQTGELLNELRRFDAARAGCYQAHEKQYLLAVVETGFGSLTPFNRLMREVLVQINPQQRQKQLERDDQYEEARALLTDALALYPPSVYRAGLYRDLCICNTKLRMQEEAAKACEQHFSVDSLSLIHI